VSSYTRLARKMHHGVQSCGHAEGDIGGVSATGLELAGQLVTFRIACWRVCILVACLKDFRKECLSCRRHVEGFQHASMPCSLNLHVCTFSVHIWLGVRSQCINEFAGFGVH
jgi:hypothetical protein